MAVYKWFCTRFGVGWKATHGACVDLDGCCMQAIRTLRKAERELAKLKPLELGSYR